MTRLFGDVKFVEQGGRLGMRPAPEPSGLVRLCLSGTRAGALNGF